LVGAIETRSLPSSLAAARRGFTFYLADPSARLTPIARAVPVWRAVGGRGALGGTVFWQASGKTVRQRLLNMADCDYE